MSEAAAAAGAAGKASKMANVRYSVYNQTGAFAGKTVAQVRAELGQQFGIPTDATAFKGKTKLEDDYHIQPGDSIEFHRKQGEKG